MQTLNKVTILPSSPNLMWPLTRLPRGWSVPGPMHWFLYLLLRFTHHSVIKHYTQEKDTHNVVAFWLINEINLMALNWTVPVETERKKVVESMNLIWKLDYVRLYCKSVDVSHIRLEMIKMLFDRKITPLNQRPE